MCDKTILENGGTLNSVPKCYKNREMCDKAVDRYPHTLGFLPVCCKTPKMCDFGSLISKYLLRTQEMCYKVVYKRFLYSIPDKYKTQRMCDKAVHDS